MKLSMLSEDFGRVLRGEFVVPGANISGWRDQLIQVQRLDDGQLEARTAQGESAIVEAEGRRADRFLDHLVEGDAHALVWAMDVVGSRLVVQAHLLRDIRPIPEGLTIALGLHAPESLRRHGFRRDLGPAIADEMCLSMPGTEHLGLLIALPTHADDGRFVIHGPRFNLEVRTQNGRAVVFRVIKTPKKRPSLTWLTGPVRFVEGDSVDAAVESTQSQLVALQNEGTYLGRWSKYNELERRIVVEQARARGVVRYAGRPRLKNRGERKLLVFLLEESLPEGLAQLAGSETRLAALDRIEMEKKSLGAAQYFQHWAMTKDDRETVRRDRARLLEARGLGRPIFLPEDGELGVEVIDATLINEIPGDGWLAVDLKGETVRLDRREDAIRTAGEHRAELGRLGSMIEGRPLGHGRVRRRPVGSITTPAVLRAMGQPSINESQRSAIATALRTPDIALILGPPGTGKTAVIRAIVARLGELDSKFGVRTRVLLTAFQHDAVDEVLKGVTLCGISGFRVGGRSGEGQKSAEQLRLEQAEQWAKPRAERASLSAAALPEEPISRAARMACDRFLSWLSAPGGSEETRRAIVQIEDLLSPYLDQAARGALHAAWQTQSIDRSPSALELDEHDRRLLHERLEGLATSATAFRDDGPRRAGRLLDVLDAAGVELRAAHRRALQEARTLDGDTAPSDRLLEHLTSVQRELKQSMGTPPTHRMHLSADPTAERAMRGALEQVGRRVDASSEGARRALEGFARALDSDLTGLAETMERYAQALGVTCQQSVRTRNDGPSADQDVVIVDEAARANPLDLLIPLVRGQRLILVGDPNQLPHVLEKQVEDQLEQDGNAQAKEILRESLFERLWKLCDRWEAEDGFRRAVQLDEQYRMHPNLGSFVSRYFYEQPEREQTPDPNRRVGNGIEDPNRFLHRFASFEGRVGAWIDVPWREGREQSTSGKSRFRTAEIEAVQRLVSKLRDEDPTSTLGVITFYKEQALRLARKLGVDLGEGDDLRVGTVDAFQGRQFDAVILSTVRANDIRSRDEEGRRARIGFLELRNRLCVAMSRARRLQIVVGCKETVAGVPEPGQSLDVLAPEGACWQLTRFYDEVCAGATTRLSRSTG